MALNAKGIVMGLVVIWKPLEVSFKDWILCHTILHRRFHYVGSKELVCLTMVYGPYILAKKVSFLSNIHAIKFVHQDEFWIQ